MSKHLIINPLEGTFCQEDREPLDTEYAFAFNGADYYYFFDPAHGAKAHHVLQADIPKTAPDVYLIFDPNEPPSSARSGCLDAFDPIELEDVYIFRYTAGVWILCQLVEYTM